MGTTKGGSIKRRDQFTVTLFLQDLFQMRF